MSTVPKAGAAKPLTPKQQIKAPRSSCGGQTRRRSSLRPSWTSSKRITGLKIEKKAFRQFLAQGRLQGVSVARACRHFGISRQA